MDHEQNVSVLEEIILETGIEVDTGEAWNKLRNSQFGGNPGRGFSELVQNGLDSYPNRLPWEEKRVDIETGSHEISITDYGQGMDQERLRLLITLGGTDKELDPDKIGKFGIGFAAIFNERLETKRVRVLTRCQEESVELAFTVSDPSKRPVIEAKVHDSEFPYSTKIIVEFENDSASKQCLDDAKRRLEYYPCNITIDSKPFTSIWLRARENNAMFFSEGSCYGFLDQSNWRKWITVLCKYEYLMRIPLPILLTGGHNTHNDLRDYHGKEVPYVPRFSISINCNDLSVTISRDSFRLDHNYSKMIRVLADMLMIELGKEIDESKEAEIILANQYILRKQLADYLRQQSQVEGKNDFVLKKLAEAKVYRMNGKTTHCSLKDLYSKLTEGLPLYFSPDRKNLRWVGGSFKHDFIVLPQVCSAENGAPHFYDELFSTIFEDVVNLDTIQENQEKIKDLVNRQIVSKESLTPRTRILGTRSLSPVERDFLGRINRVIKHPGVAQAIKRNIHISYDQAECVYFDSDGRDAYIATGLLAANGKALNKMVLANLSRRGQDQESPGFKKLDRLCIDILRRHQIIDFLVNCDDKHKEYYAITYLSHELALCQKHLVPYSDFYHVVKDRLAEDVRKAVMGELLAQSQAV